MKNRTLTLEGSKCIDKFWHHRKLKLSFLIPALQPLNLRVIGVAPIFCVEDEQRLKGVSNATYSSSWSSSVLLLCNASDCSVLVVASEILLKWFAVALCPLLLVLYVFISDPWCLLYASRTHNQIGNEIKG